MTKAKQKTNWQALAGMRDTALKNAVERNARILKQAEALQAKIETQICELRDLRALVATANADKERAWRAEQETRRQFKDLKERLHFSQTERARLNGYIERVRDTDRPAPDPAAETTARHVVPSIQIETYEPRRAVSNDRHWMDY